MGAVEPVLHVGADGGALVVPHVSGGTRVGAARRAGAMEGGLLVVPHVSGGTCVEAARRAGVGVGRGAGKGMGFHTSGR